MHSINLAKVRFIHLLHKCRVETIIAIVIVQTVTTGSV